MFGFDEAAAGEQASVVRQGEAGGEQQAGQGEVPGLGFGGIDQGGSDGFAAVVWVDRETAEVEAARFDLPEDAAGEGLADPGGEPPPRSFAVGPSAARLALTEAVVSFRAEGGGSVATVWAAKARPIRAAAAAASSMRKGRTTHS